MNIMNNKISEILKKLTICTMVLVFSFILFSPAINALGLDPNNPWNQHNPGSNTPSGDIDPWEEFEIYDPPPDDNNRYLSFFSDVKIGITIFLYFKLGWNVSNLQKTNTPIRNINKTTPDNCDKDSKQTIRNR